MGCMGSKEEEPEGVANEVYAGKGEKRVKAYLKPKWKSDEHLTTSKLAKLRDEFWDTQPHYGGDRVIWDALKAAIEAPDMAMTKLIIESAGIIVAASDMTVCYDERGAKYDLPKFVLSDPVNLERDTE